MIQPVSAYDDLKEVSRSRNATVVVQSIGRSESIYDGRSLRRGARKFPYSPNLQTK